MILNVKSDYTFLSSTLTLDTCISKTKQYHYSTSSLCDYQNMFGVYSFYQLCLKNQIRPIIGVEYQLEYEKQKAAIFLYAKDEIGYQQLVFLTSFVNEKNNVLTLDILKKHQQGLVFIISTFDSHLTHFILENRIDLANQFLSDIKAITSSVYLGVYRYKNISIDLDFFKEFALQYQISAIAFQYATHQSKEDTLILNLLSCIKKQESANRNFLQDDAIVESYFKSYEELKIAYDEDELTNLRQLLSILHVKIPQIPFRLPHLVNQPEQYLYQICQEKLQEKQLGDLYQKRMQYELDIIQSMGFSDYFLIVADYVEYAKKHGILVGPGRGSAGGSLIAYLLNITTIDPIQYDLLFERFLNPKRVSMPDIDIDFLDIRRDEIINYVKEKYGANHVAQIATFSTLGAKSAIRDMARILNISNDEVDYLLKFYPKNADISINEAYKTQTKFKEIVNMHSHLKQLVALASKIEGLKRQSGIHAAGILMHADSLNQLVPTITMENGLLLCQYDYKCAEQVGLLKMDFLGLKNLNVLDVCLKLIHQTTNQKLAMENLPWNQKEVYDFLSKGHCLGIFQLESDGMVQTIKQMQPTCFADIVNLLAIYRPGPMQNIHTFIKRMHNEEKITYPHFSLEEILKPTYGVIVYQEQIMQIVQKLAGFDLAQADIFRRAITKKNATALEKLKDGFVKGCLNNGIEIKTALEIYQLIFSFAEYGFNKSHSVAYAKVAVMMAYLKMKYPTLFYTSLLLVSDEKKDALFKEAKKLGVIPALPSLNHSELTYCCQENKIRFGLQQIQFIKGKLANSILEERKKGPFLTIYDAMIRLAKLDISQTALKALIYSGCFDEFSYSRTTLIQNLSALYEYGKMFLNLPYEINDYQEYDYIPLPILKEYAPDNAEFSYEKEYLGIYISQHPILKIKEKKNIKTNQISEIFSFTNSTIFGKIIRIDYRNSKQNKPMGILEIEDETDTITLFVYGEMLQKSKEMLQKNDYAFFQLSCKEQRVYVNDIQKYEE